MNINLYFVREKKVRSPKEGDIFEVKTFSYDEYDDENREGLSQIETEYTSDLSYAFSLLEEAKKRYLNQAQNNTSSEEDFDLEFGNYFAELTRTEYKEGEFKYSHNGVRIKNLTALAEKK